jgi:hypothetical protein
MMQRPGGADKCVGANFVDCGSLLGVFAAAAPSEGHVPRQVASDLSLTRAILGAPSPGADYTGDVSRLSLFLALGVVFTFAACSRDRAKAPAPSESPKSEPVKPAPEASGETTGGDLGYGDDARLFATPGEAIAIVLSEVGSSVKPRVVGFGEYHKLTSSAPVHSALRRFAEEIFDSLAENSAHLVLETWQVDPSCGKQAQAVREQVEKTIERPPETESEMTVLLRKMEQSGTAPHILQFACNEYKALLDDTGLNTEKLLTLISRKLEEQTRKALAIGPENKLVLIYGGATHNNLFPYEGLEHWSFAKAVAEATNQAYIEIDLYVPELVSGDPLLSSEPWYPLLAQARTDQVILIRRDPASYILLLRKDYVGQELAIE